MSRAKQLERNVDAYLAQFEGQLQPNWRSMPFAKKNLIANMSRNGITPRDLDNARLEGRNNAYQETAPAVMQVVYCAVGLVLHEKYGFDREKIEECIMDVDSKVMETLDKDEIASELKEKVGLKISTKEGVGRIEEVD